MWPKQERALLNGGSIYWVIKGFIQCRQRIVRLDEVFGQDGIRRCAIGLEPGLIRTTSAPKRPFQGWRYLEVADAPIDVGTDNDENMPSEFVAELRELGIF